MKLRRHVLTGIESSVHRVNTVISDRYKGIISAVQEAMPESHHGYCLKHIEANLMHKFKDQACQHYVVGHPSL